MEEEREKQHTGHEHAHTTKQMAHYDAMAISSTALNFRGVYQLPSPSTVVYGARYNPEGLISELTIGPHKNDGKLCPEAVRAVYKVTEAREHMRKLAVERALFLIPDPIPDHVTGQARYAKRTNLIVLPVVRSSRLISGCPYLFFLNILIYTPKLYS